MKRGSQVHLFSSHIRKRGRENSLKHSFVLIAGVLLVLMLGYGVSALVTEYRVSPTSDSGRGAIAISNDGKVFFSYYDSSASKKDLKLCSNAVYNDTDESGDVSDGDFPVWGCFTLDSGGNVGTESSIAIGSDNKIYVSYRDASSNDLKFCKIEDINARPSAGWPCSILDGTGPVSVGRNPSTAIASDGTVSVLYYSETGKKLKRCSNAAATTLATATGSCLDADLVAKPLSKASLVFDGTVPHVALIQNYTGKLSHCIPETDETTTETWTCDVVDPAVGSNYNNSASVSMAIDSDHKIHIVSEKKLGTSKRLMYCNDVDGSWSCLNVSHGGPTDTFNPSLAIDSDNNARVIFQKNGLNYCFVDVTGDGKATCSLLDNSLVPVAGGEALALSDYINIFARNPSTSAGHYINISLSGAITPAPPGTTPPSPTPPSTPPSGTDTNIYYTAGKVGIGKTNPQYTLDVNGDVGAADFLYTSDLRLKENIAPLFGSLSKILQLRGVSFDWKKSGERNVGFIAQDVEKVIPELVSTGADGFKSVRYGNLVAVLTEAIKEQQLQIEKQQKEIDELKNEFERLKNERR